MLFVTLYVLGALLGAGITIASAIAFLVARSRVIGLRRLLRDSQISVDYYRGKAETAQALASRMTALCEKVRSSLGTASAEFRGRQAATRELYAWLNDELTKKKVAGRCRPERAAAPVAAPQKPQAPTQAAKPVQKPQPTHSNGVQGGKPVQLVGESNKAFKARKREFYNGAGHHHT